MSLPVIATPVHFNSTGIATSKFGIFASEPSNAVSGSFMIDITSAVDNDDGFSTSDNFDDSLYGLITPGYSLISITGTIRLGALVFSVNDGSGVQRLHLIDGIVDNLDNENYDSVRLVTRETSPGSVTYGVYTSASLELYAEDRVAAPGDADGLLPGSGGLDDDPLTALSLLLSLDLSLFDERTTGRYITSELVGEFPPGVPLFQTIDELEFEWTGIEAVVPLPPAAWLLLSGAAGLYGLARRRTPCSTPVSRVMAAQANVKR
jgi:hypothetical protein